MRKKYGLYRIKITGNDKGVSVYWLTIKIDKVPIREIKPALV